MVKQDKVCLWNLLLQLLLLNFSFASGLSKTGRYANGFRSENKHITCRANHISQDSMNIFQAEDKKMSAKWN